jgi:hypothetical protein
MRFRFLDATSSSPARMFLLPGQDLKSHNATPQGETDMRLVTDRDVQDEIEFFRRRKLTAPLTGVVTTDRLTTDAQQFAFLRRLNQRMREFWATHAEGASL